ncbi:MAG: TlpA disulfide reductase family protein [Planctomycetota bacterium]|nr:TlpA disulfide reductase family protein [Planctomycetota bacterium]
MKSLSLNVLACWIGLAVFLVGCGDDGSTPPDAGAPTTAPTSPETATAPAIPAPTAADPAATAEPAAEPKTIPESGASKPADKAAPAENKKEIPEAKKPAAKKPAAKKPAAKKPAAKKPEAKKPEAKKPEAKKPEAKKPAAGDAKDKKKDTAQAKGKPAPPTVDSQMRALLALANQGELAKSLAQINIVLARKDLATVEEQKRRAIIFFASQIAQALGRQHISNDETVPGHAAFVVSANHFRTLQTKFKPLFPQEAGFGATVFYNEACALAAKDAKKARASLTTAVDLGFNDFKQIKTDKDLAPLRKTAGFDQFVAKQEALAAKKADEALTKELAANKTFPFDFTLPDLAGKPVSLESFQGQVVIVDVWGTWCPPCRAEVPHFVDLQKNYGKKGLQIVGINYERSADPIPGIKSFAKEHGINYPLVIGDEATQNKIPQFQAFPTTLFIDRKGEVRLVAVGARPHEYLEAVVKKLLSEPAPAGTKPPAKKASKPAVKKADKKATPAKKPVTKKPAAKKKADKK